MHIILARWCQVAGTLINLQRCQTVFPPLLFVYTVFWIQGEVRGGKKKEKKKQKCLKMNKSRKTRLTKSPFCFHNSYCNISQTSRVCFFFPLPLLFPLRSVIQLHFLDVLLKSIMDSWGFPCFSSSFTEYSQCYSNLPTTPSCIGNEPQLHHLPSSPREIIHLYAQPPDKHTSMAHIKKS